MCLEMSYKKRIPTPSGDTTNKLKEEIKRLTEGKKNIRIKIPKDSLQEYIATSDIKKIPQYCCYCGEVLLQSEYSDEILKCIACNRTYYVNIDRHEKFVTNIKVNHLILIEEDD